MPNIFDDAHRGSHPIDQLPGFPPPPSVRRRIRTWVSTKPPVVVGSMTALVVAMAGAVATAGMSWSGVWTPPPSLTANVPLMQYILPPSSGVNSTNRVAPPALAPMQRMAGREESEIVSSVGPVFPGAKAELAAAQPGVPQPSALQPGVPGVALGPGQTLPAVPAQGALPVGAGPVQGQPQPGQPQQPPADQQPGGAPWVPGGQDAPGSAGQQPPVGGGEGQQPPPAPAPPVVEQPPAPPVEVPPAPPAPPAPPVEQPPAPPAQDNGGGNGHGRPDDKPVPPGHDKDKDKDKDKDERVPPGHSKKGKKQQDEQTAALLSAISGWLFSVLAA